MKTVAIAVVSLLVVGISFVGCKKSDVPVGTAFNNASTVTLKAITTVPAKKK